MIYSNNTYDITANISTYTRRDFKQVYDTTQNKWYMLNNLNSYEEYGIYGDSFSTYYLGKLVIVNNHEYEWNGAEWDDLGEFVERCTSVYRDSSHTGSIVFPQYIRNISSFSATLKFTQYGGDVFLGSSGISDQNDWRTFYWSSRMFYDCGSGRIDTNQVGLNNTYNLLFSGNPMKLTNLTTGTVIYTGNTTRPSSGDYNFYFGSRSDYGYLYDLVLYSDNDGQTPIAHYVPKVQNNVIGMYDTINEVFVAATGTLGAEYSTVRPKDYPTKTTPTIYSLYPSKIYRNSGHLSKLYRYNNETAIMDYMSGDLLKKGEAPLPMQIFDYLYVPSNALAEWDTGLNTNTNDIEIELQIKFPSSATGISGIYGSDFSGDGQLLYSDYSGSSFKFHAGHTEGTLNISNFLNRWITVNQTTSSITIDNQVFTYNYLGPMKSGNLKFFNVGTNSTWKYKDAMIKYIKIKRGNNLLFNVVPAQDPTTMKKGFKNLVDNTFIEVTEINGSIILGNE